MKYRFTKYRFTKYRFTKYRFTKWDRPYTFSILLPL